MYLICLCFKTLRTNLGLPGDIEIYNFWIKKKHDICIDQDSLL